MTFLSSQSFLLSGSTNLPNLWRPLKPNAMMVLNKRSSNDLLKKAADFSMSSTVSALALLIGVEKDFWQPFMVFLSFSDMRMFLISGYKAEKWKDMPDRYEFAEEGLISREVSEMKWQRFFSVGIGSIFLNSQYLKKRLTPLWYFDLVFLPTLLEMLVEFSRFLSSSDMNFTCFFNFNFKGVMRKDINEVENDREIWKMGRNF